MCLCVRRLLVAQSLVLEKRTPGCSMQTTLQHQMKALEGVCGVLETTGPVD